MKISDLYSRESFIFWIFFLIVVGSLILVSFPYSGIVSEVKAQSDNSTLEKTPPSSNATFTDNITSDFSLKESRVSVEPETPAILSLIMNALRITDIRSYMYSSVYGLII